MQAILRFFATVFLEEKTMSGCPEITLENLTPEKYTALLAAAKSQGLDLSGDAGTTHYQGMNFQWSYDPAAQTLRMQCLEKPIFIPCHMIEQKIRQLVA